MLKKTRKWIKIYLKPLNSHTPPPNLEFTERERRQMNLNYIPMPFTDREEDVHRRNQQRLDLARFQQDKEAIDKNLLAQHRLMIATLLLALVAILSTVAAVIIALTAKPPIVNVQVPTNSVRH